MPSKYTSKNLHTNLTKQEFQSMFEILLAVTLSL